jgi:hypothetical protein
MFKCAAWQIAGDAGVQNAVASIGHEIEPAACHASIEEDVDGRDKPGHDGNTTLIAQFLRNASIGFNAGNGINAVSGSASVTIDIIRSAIETNGLAGILSNQSGGGSSSVTVGSSQISGNGVGMQSAGGGSLRTYSNNQVTGNQTTGSFTGTIGLQ